MDAATAGGVVDRCGIFALAAADSLTTDLRRRSPRRSLDCPAIPIRCERAAALQLLRRRRIDSLTSTGPDANLGRAGRRSSRILQDRLNKASAVVIASAQPADLTALLGTIFGADYVVLPRFTPPDFASLTVGVPQSTRWSPPIRRLPHAGSRSSAHVRPGISRLDACLSVAQLLGGDTHVPPPSLLLASFLK